MEPDNNFTSTRIWILRHGRSTLNDAQIFQGCGTASELTDEGIESARAAGARLKDEKIDVIYTSPLQRAVQTSELVRAELKQNQEYPTQRIDDALREMELPSWEGLPYSAVREQYPGQYQAFRQNPESFSLTSPGQGEVYPVLDMDKRVREFIATVTQRNAGRRILLVTHGGPASAVLLAALKLPLRHFHSMQITHGGLSCLSVQSWPDWVWLDKVNEISQPTRRLPKLKNGKSGLRLLLVASDRSDDPAIREDWLAETLQGLAIQGVLAAGQDGYALATRLLSPDQQACIVSGTSAEIFEALDRHRNSPHSDGLSNLLIAARGDLITAVLAWCMRWDGTDFQTRLEPCRGLSVIHLPDSNQQPVLQAMNVCGMSTAAKEGIA